MVSCTARLLSSLCPFALDCWFIDTDYWRYILGTLETDFAWIEVDTVLLVSLKCRLQIIVFAMQMSSWQQQCHCFLTLKTIVRSQSAVCILHCPPFNANPQKLIFTLFEGIVWHLWATFLSGTTAVMAMSLLQQLKCQLKYHKKYVLLQNNNCLDRSDHPYVYLFVHWITK